MKMAKEKSNNIWLIIFGVIIVILLAWIILSNVNKETPVTCQKPYIMGDNGQCCKDIDENNICDPTDLKLSWQSNGVRKDGDLSVDYAIVCNADEYPGTVTAYFGDIQYYNEVDYRQSFQEKYGFSLSFSDKETWEILARDGNIETKQAYLKQGECNEFSFKYLYKDGMNIRLETYGEPDVSK